MLQTGCPRGIVFEFLAGASDFSLLLIAQTSSGVHPPTHSVDSQGFFSGRGNRSELCLHFPIYVHDVCRDTLFTLCII
jgi:hypothetical protein